MTVTLQQLESRLWDAANALRGPVDPADFKTYVFPMLFWKWISDTWEYEHAEAVADYGDDLTDEIESDFHRFELPDGARWNQVTAEYETIAAAAQRDRWATLIRSCGLTPEPVSYTHLTLPTILRV